MAHVPVHCDSPGTRPLGEESSEAKDGNLVVPSASPDTGSGGALSPSAGNTRPRGGVGGPSSKASNANHLLNFQTYATHSGRGSDGRLGGRSGRRGGPGGRGPVGGSSRYSHNTSTRGKPQRYDRNQFLQANFRFLVSDAVDIARFQSDADLMFDWDDVVEVELAVIEGSKMQCPISLDSPPICPQITPCGHVFSFPSIMQHLVNHGGDNLRCSAPCPLCFAPVVARELRLVRPRAVKAPLKVGDSITFQLLKRSKDSILPQAMSSSSIIPPLQGGGNCETGGLLANIFAKFAVVSGDEATELWRESALELAKYAVQVTSEGGLEAAILAPFIYASLEALSSRARRWTQRWAGSYLSSCDAETFAAEAEAAIREVFTAASSAPKGLPGDPKPSPVADIDIDFPSLPTATKPVQTPPNNAKTKALATGMNDGIQGAGSSPKGLNTGFGDLPFEAAFSDDDDDDDDDTNPSRPPTCGSDAIDIPTAGTSPPLAPSLEVCLTGTSPNTGTRNASDPTRDEYFMYQSIDGTWIFIHPTNLRCLLHHYKTYEACPRTLTATILELEDVVQCESTRKRLRLLAHLPMTANFKLAEVNLTALLPPESLAPFADELQQRERRRRKQAADERRAAARETAEMKAAVDARRGPSLQELRAMPALGKSKPPSEFPRTASAAIAHSEEGAGSSTSLTGTTSNEDLAMQLAIEASLVDPTQPGCEPPGGVGWARLVKMGYAATGPVLGSSPQQSAGLQQWQQQPHPAGVWGSKKGSIAMPAATGPSSLPKPASSVAGPWGGSAAGTSSTLPIADSDGGAPSSGKTKSKKGTLLFSTSQRKY